MTSPDGWTSPGDTTDEDSVISAPPDLAVDDELAGRTSPDGGGEESLQTASSDTRTDPLERLNRPIRALKDLVTNVWTIVTTTTLLIGLLVVEIGSVVQDGDDRAETASTPSAPSQEGADTVATIQLPGRSEECFDGLTPPTLIAAASDGALVAASRGDQIHLMRDDCSAQPESAPAPGAARVTAITFGGDSSSLYVGTTDGLIWRFKTVPFASAGAPVIAGAGEVSALAAGDDSTLVSGTAGGSVRRWTSDLVEIALGEAPEISVGAGVENIALTALGDTPRAFIVKGTGELGEVDLATGDVDDDPWNSACDVHAVATSATRLYVFGRECAYVVDLADDALTDPLPTGHERFDDPGETPAYAAAGTRDGEDIVIVSGSGGGSDASYVYVEVWAVDRGEVWDVGGVAGDHADVTVSPGSNTLSWVDGTEVKRHQMPAT